MNKKIPVMLLLPIPLEVKFLICELDSSIVTMRVIKLSFEVNCHTSKYVNYFILMETFKYDPNRGSEFVCVVGPRTLSSGFTL